MGFLTERIVLLDLTGFLTERIERIVLLDLTGFLTERVHDVVTAMVTSFHGHAMFDDCVQHQPWLGSSQEHWRVAR
jgi:hypothetical protein